MVRYPFKRKSNANFLLADCDFCRKHSLSSFCSHDYVRFHIQVREFLTYHWHQLLFDLGILHKVRRIQL